MTVYAIESTGIFLRNFLLQFVILFRSWRVRAHFVSQQILYKFSGKKYDNIHHLQIIPIFYEKKNTNKLRP